MRGADSAIKVGRADFGNEPVGGIAGPQDLVGLCVAGFRIAGLNDKLFDYPVEQQAVVEAALGQLDEIVPVFGCAIVQHNLDPAVMGIQNGIGVRVPFAAAEEKKAQKHCAKQSWQGAVFIPLHVPTR